MSPASLSLIPECEFFGYIFLKQEQNAFKRGRSCMESMFAVQQLMETHRECNIEMYLLFVDFIKAFDVVAQKELWETLAEKEFHIFSKDSPKYEPN
jgi:hypothetical protein